MRNASESRFHELMPGAALARGIYEQLQETIKAKREAVARVASIEVIERQQQDAVGQPVDTIIGNDKVSLGHKLGLLSVIYGGPTVVSAELADRVDASLPKSEGDFTPLMLRHTEGHTVAFIGSANASDIGFSRSGGLINVGGFVEQDESGGYHPTMKPISFGPNGWVVDSSEAYWPYDSAEPHHLWQVSMDGIRIAKGAGEYLSGQGNVLVGRVAVSEAVQEIGNTRDQGLGGEKSLLFISQPYLANRIVELSDLEEHFGLGEMDDFATSEFGAIVKKYFTDNILGQEELVTIDKRFGLLAHPTILGRMDQGRLEAVMSEGIGRAISKAIHGYKNGMEIDQSGMFSDPKNLANDLGTLVEGIMHKHAYVIDRSSDKAQIARIVESVERTNEFAQLQRAMSGRSSRLKKALNRLEKAIGNRFVNI